MLDFSTPAAAKSGFGANELIQNCIIKRAERVETIESLQPEARAAGDER